jgi:hypothetical protein
MREWIYMINRWRIRVGFAGLIIALILAVLIWVSKGIVTLFA